MTRHDVLDALLGLSEVQLGILIEILRVDPAILPGSTSAPAMRALALLRLFNGSEAQTALMDGVGWVVERHGAGASELGEDPPEQRDERPRNYGKGDCLADRFWLEGELGRGRYTQTWNARDLSLGSSVVLKCLQKAGEPASQAVQTVFEQEIRALSSMHHTNLVSLLYEGDDHGHRFYVLECIEGQPLNLCGISLDVVLWVFHQLLSVLGYIHARGVIHSNLKPSQILLCQTASGLEPKLLGFNTGLGVDRVSPHSSESLWEGEGESVRYRSPEQFSGEGVGPASDLYSLGVMLFESLSGALPFEGPVLGDYHLQHTLMPPPRLCLPSGLGCLEELVADLLEKDYYKRPERAANVRARLVSIYQGLPHQPGRGQLPQARSLGTGVLEVPAPLVCVAEQGHTRILEALSLEGRNELCESLLRDLSEVAEHGEACLRLISGPRGIGRRSLAGWLAGLALEEGLARVCRVDIEAWPTPTTAMRRAVLELLRFPTQQPRTLELRVGEALPGLDQDTRYNLIKLLMGSLEGLSERLPEILVSLFRALSAREPALPVLLWLDGYSESGQDEVLEWILPVMRLARKQSCRVMVVVCTPSLDTHPALKSLMNGLEHTELKLEPLNEEASRRVALRAEPRLSSRAVEFLLSHCQGFPFFIHEQLETWRKNSALKETEEGLALTEEARALSGSSIERLMDARLISLFGDISGNRQLSEALQRLALLGTTFSRRQLGRVLEGTGIYPEMLLVKRVIVPRGIQPEALLSFADTSLQQILVNAAKISDSRGDLTRFCVELRLMFSLDAQLESDWDMANNEILKARRLLLEHPSEHTQMLELGLLDALGRLSFRRRNVGALEGVCTELEALSQVSEAETGHQPGALALLWCGFEAYAKEELQRSKGLFRSVCGLDSAPLFCVAQAWLYRGLLALRELDYERAHVCFEHALHNLFKAIPDAQNNYQRRLMRLTCADVMRSQGELNGRREQWDEQTERLEEARKIFQKEEDLQGECQILILKARMFRERHESLKRKTTTLDSKYTELAHRGLSELDGVIGASDERGHALKAWERAELARVEGENSLAEKNYQLAHWYFKRCCADFEASLVTHARGTMARQSGRYLDALEHYKRFREDLPKTSPSTNEAVALNSMGWMALRLMQDKEAQLYFNQALMLLNDLEGSTPPEVDVAEAHAGIAVSSLRLGSPEPAASLEHLEAAAALTREQKLDDLDVKWALESVYQTLKGTIPINMRGQVQLVIDTLLSESRG